MLPKDKKVKELNFIFQNSRFLDKLVFTVKLKDSLISNTNSLMYFADSLIEALKQSESKNQIKEITAKVSEDFLMEIYGTVHENLPIFLDSNDYKEIEKSICDTAIQQAMQNNYSMLLSPGSMVMKDNIAKDPLGFTYLALKKLQSLQLDDNFEIIDGSIFSKDKKHLLFFLTPKEPKNQQLNTALIKNIDEILEKAATQNPKIQTEYFGSIAVAAANADRIKRDVMMTVSITLLILFVSLTFFFRKPFIFFVIFLPVLFGGTFSIALLFLIKGSVSGIAIGAGSIVLGIAINYSLHFYTHYRHTGSILQNLKDLSSPMTIGGFTTIGAFLSLLTIESEAIQDFGMFAAFSLIGASLFTLIVMPHFFAQNTSRREEYFPLLDKLSAYNFSQHKTLLIGLMICTCIFGYFSSKVEFESDVMKMNYITEKLAKAENNLNRISNVSLKSIYIVASGKNLEEALVNSEKNQAQLEQLLKEKKIKKYSSVGTILISHSLQRERIQLWQKFWSTEKKEKLKNACIQYGTALRFNTDAFQGFYNLLNKKFTPISLDQNKEIQSVFLSNFISQTKEQTSIVTLVKADAINEREVLSAFQENENNSAFSRKFLTEKFIDIIHNNFNKILLFSSLLVFLTLLISFGRIELALITYLPMVVSWILILGIMGLIGIKFNIINIIISTFIFGLGDDYSIFIMDGLFGEYKSGQKNLASYKTSIFLSAFTTLIGIGVLIFAKHPALKSIGLITIIGMLCVLLVANTLQPFLAKWLIEKKGKKRLVPISFGDILISLISFGLFIAGSICLTIIGILFFKIIPVKSKRIKLLYHYCIQYFSRIQIYSMAIIPKKIINKSNEKFEKPAVVIANHQSLIDLPLMMMLNPKLLILTNDWVWNNKLYGMVVKFADYYPVSNDVEKGLELMRERFKEGYSILIFPEGTRSEDGLLGRFHKGAFYLAEQLGADIVPIMIHGANDCLSKRENILKSGRITVSILPRIKHADETYGKSYQERTKLISKYYKSVYSEFKSEIETVAYLKGKLIKNYIYKGPFLEWYMRVKIKMEGNYQLFDSLLPKKGKITDIGCGYGFLTHMLSFVSSEREITGIDYDEEKISVAQNCISKKNNVNFIAADITKHSFDNADAFVISDVLHYLTDEQQSQLIENCVNKLQPGGLILLRDGNSDLEKRHRGTRYTEFFSTNFGFNKTQNKLSFVSGKKLIEFCQGLDLIVETIDNTKFTSNLIYVLRKK